MAVSRAQQLAKDKYRKEKRDQMTIEVPKGKRDTYKTKAAELGISLSKLIQLSIENYNVDENPPVQNPDKLSSADKKLVEEFNKLPVDTQKALSKLITSINQNKKGGD